jgi:hypothetical protein
MRKFCLILGIVSVALIAQPATQQLPPPVEDAPQALRHANAGALHTPPEAQVVTVRAGESLQAAVNAAPPGAVIALEAGAEYVGSLLLPLKACEPVTTITTAGFARPAGTRIDPSSRGQLAVLRSGSVQAAIRMAEGTCGWAIRGLAFEANEKGQHEIIEIGRASDTKTVEGLPRQITLSQILIDVAGPQKRGIGANGLDVTIEDSWLSGFYMPGQDSQAIAGWNTRGPITIRRNYLAAGSEVILFGGAAPGIANIVPADILVERNVLTRPAAWRGGPHSTYVVKNLFELKAGVRVTVRDNVMEHHWQAAQPGWAIVLTPRTQGGRCKECRIEDVVIERNVIRAIGGGFNIAATDDKAPTHPTRRITIRDNLVEIDHAEWPGPGRFMQVIGAVENLHVEHNTITQSGTSFLQGLGAPASGFRLVGNLIRPTGRHGFFSTGTDGVSHAHGLKWQERWPGGVIEGNAFAGWAGNAASRANLPGNIFPSVADAVIVDGYGTGAVAGHGRRR